MVWIPDMDVGVVRDGHSPMTEQHPMVGLGKGLILIGGMLILVGVVLVFFEKIPFLGKLPGDIHIKKDNLEIYIPIATSLLLSGILSLIFWIVSSFNKK